MQVMTTNADLVANLEICYDQDCIVKLEMVRNTFTANTLQNWTDYTQIFSLEKNLTSHNCSIFILAEQVFQNCHCEAQFCTVYLLYDKSDLERKPNCVP